MVRAFGFGTISTHRQRALCLEVSPSEPVQPGRHRGSTNTFCCFFLIAHSLRPFTPPPPSTLSLSPVHTEENLSFTVKVMQSYLSQSLLLKVLHPAPPPPHPSPPVHLHTRR